MGRLERNLQLWGAIGRRDSMPGPSTSWFDNSEGHNTLLLCGTEQTSHYRALLRLLAANYELSPAESRVCQVASTKRVLTADPREGSRVHNRAGEGPSQPLFPKSLPWRGKGVEREEMKRGGEGGFWKYTNWLSANTRKAELSEKSARSNKAST